ncbi:hypothetical protein [Planococcus sp. YIM B11945]|uniref:hypothetical protein n=1 Tax=Planococcus sp. YIM B11945 TaxID=3435410 RepID=UPI003D7DAC54
MAFSAIVSKADHDLEGLENKKRRNGRLGSTGVRRSAEAALFARTTELAYDPKS